MNWQITDTGRKPRVVVLVSHEGHCLYDLLGRVAAGELDVDMRAVIGNHPTHAAVTRARGIPFHHVAFPDDGDPDAN
jgi:formyltetrahydrofolate deformylase